LVEPTVRLVSSIRKLYRTRHPITCLKRGRLRTDLTRWMAMVSGVDGEALVETIQSRMLGTE
jgi:hypothetical protein